MFKNILMNLIFALCLLVGLHSSFCAAKNLDEVVADIQQKSESLKNRLSMDVTPIDFTVGAIHYRVPRNYIRWMDNWNGGAQSLVGIVVTYPDIQPMNEATKNCLTLPPLQRPTGCIPIEFNIQPSTPVSDDEGFENMRGVFHSQKPDQGSYGFEMYEIGPDNARSILYRKPVKGHTLIINCDLGDIHNNPISVCSNHSRLPNTNSISYILNDSKYFFNGGALKNAEDIDLKLRSLVSKFIMPSPQFQGDKK